MCNIQGKKERKKKRELRPEADRRERLWVTKVNFLKITVLYCSVLKKRKEINFCEVKYSIRLIKPSI